MGYLRVRKGSAGKDVPGAEATLKRGDVLKMDALQTLEWIDKVSDLHGVMKHAGTSDVKWKCIGHTPFDARAWVRCENRGF